MEFINSSQGTNDIISIYHNRRTFFLKFLPKYFIVIICISIALPILSLYFNIDIGLFSVFLNKYSNISNFYLPQILHLVFTYVADIFLNIINLFSISFFPFLVIMFFKTIKKDETKYNSIAFWFMLVSASFLPVFLNAIIWSISATQSFGTIEYKIPSSFLLFISISLIIYFIIWVGLLIRNNSNPVIFILFFGIIQNSVIFCTYHLGISEASYANMTSLFLIAILNFTSIVNFSKEALLLDYPRNISRTALELLNQKKNLNESSDKLLLKEMNLELNSKQSSQQNKYEELEFKKELMDRLNNIKRTQLEFNKKVHSAELEVFQNKASLLENLFQILSSEFSNRIKSEIPEKIYQLKNDAKNYSPKELQDNMQKIYLSMNKSLSEIPISLSELRIEMNSAITSLRKQTLLLTETNVDLDEKTEDIFAKSSDSAPLEYLSIISNQVEKNINNLDKVINNIKRIESKIGRA